MSQSVDVSAELFVPREVVFQAWSEPAHLKGWYPAPGEHLAFPDTERDSAWWLLRDADRHQLEARHRVDAEPPERLTWNTRLDTEDGAAANDRRRYRQRRRTRSSERAVADAVRAAGELLLGDLNRLEVRGRN